MLCRHCARTLPSPRLSLTLTLNRTLTSSPNTFHPSNPPAATSTSAAQPFSTPLTPSPANTPTTATKPSKPSSSSSHPRSSLLAGTPLSGLAYLKPPAPAPIARDDTEYPSWLWDLLSPSGENNNAKDDGGEAGGDAFAKSKKQRRIAAKAARARVGADGGVEGREVVVQKRSVDLAVDAPGGEGGGRRGHEEREGLKRAMRRERRGKVREGNFLRGMR